MKIGIDARGLDGNRAGIPKYIEEIIKKFNSFTDEDNEYVLYSPREIKIENNLKDNIIIKDGNMRFGSFWLYLKLPKILKEDSIDVFWGTQHCLPKRNKYTKNMKFVLTIHDLAIKKLKTVGSIKNTIIQMLFLKKSIKNADKIIAISEATKKDIIEIYNIKKEKIDVIYNGTNFEENLVLNEKTKSEIQEKFKINNIPYIFFLSTIEPRKNVETLIKAFNYIKGKENISLKLIIAGGLGWKYGEVIKLFNESPYKEDIEMPGYISKEEKDYLYQNTKCFVYPSLYEGFGLPILEAMARKSLVITANNSSLPEVGGDVAFYYNNVLDYEELGNKILEIIKLDENEKQKRIEAGIEQAKRFTWEQCAKETLKICKE